MELDELHIRARSTVEGYEFDFYDAESVFKKALALMKADRCAEALPLFDRVANEFPTNRYVSHALYNAGLCFQLQQRWASAAQRYERLLSEVPGSPNVKHSYFQLAFLYLELERWEDALSMANRILARDDLDSDERAEAMSRRAEAWLGKRDLDEAAQAARATLRFYRTRREEPISDPFFVASANFVLAETIRLRSEAIIVPEAAALEQHEALERRARLLLEAQRAYFDTIKLADAYWTSAAGYHIGAMYDRFWSAIMTAPVPPPSTRMNDDELALYRQEFRTKIASMVRPLIWHAVRYWELTLRLVGRTGLQTEWTSKISADLELARERLRNQPIEG